MAIYRTKSSATNTPNVDTLGGIMYGEQNGIIKKRMMKLFILIYSDSTDGIPHFNEGILGAITNQLLGLLKENNLFFVAVRQFKDYKDLKNKIEIDGLYGENTRCLIYSLTQKLQTKSNLYFEDWWGLTYGFTSGSIDGEARNLKPKNKIQCYYAGGTIHVGNIYNPLAGTENTTDNKGTIPTKKYNLGNNSSLWLSNSFEWKYYVTDWYDTAWAILHEASHGIGFIIDSIFSRYIRINSFLFEPNTFEHLNEGFIETDGEPLGVATFVEIVKQKGYMNKKFEKINPSRYENWKALSYFNGSLAFKLRFLNQTTNSSYKYEIDWINMPQEYKKTWSFFADVYFKNCAFFQYR